MKIISTEFMKLTVVEIVLNKKKLSKKKYHFHLSVNTQNLFQEQIIYTAISNNVFKILYAVQNINSDREQKNNSSCTSNNAHKTPLSVAEINSGPAVWMENKKNTSRNFKQRTNSNNALP